MSLTPQESMALDAIGRDLAARYPDLEHALARMHRSPGRARPG